MMDHLLSCKCGEVIVKSLNGTTKVRGKVLVFKGDKAFAVCKGCGSEREVPLQIVPGSLKITDSRPKLFLSKSRKIEVFVPPKRK